MAPPHLPNPTVYTPSITGRTWLSDSAFELTIERPMGFRFTAGQRIRIYCNGLERDYSLACGPGAPHLSLCIRRVAPGPVSSLLSEATMGTMIQMTGPFGYFCLQPSTHAVVWVATGTGIAPFRSMAANGSGSFTLLHGVKTADELYYRREFESAARSYVPCLSAPSSPVEGAWTGRVTDYVKGHLPVMDYDFYLCGRREMVRDMTDLIDERYSSSRVYSEIFF